jgi:prolyl-tRNA editing enzyme YbaK/EbsC (Cys-tRNA(Pro) deacylase)
VDETKLAEHVGEELNLAPPDFVREQTGYAIGGVPPLGHEQKLPAYLDQDLLQYSEIWAAAGSPMAVFPISPGVIQAAAEAQVLELAA